MVGTQGPRVWSHLLLQQDHQGGYLEETYTALGSSAGEHGRRPGLARPAKRPRSVGFAIVSRIYRPQLPQKIPVGSMQAYVLWPRRVKRLLFSLEMPKAVFKMLPPRLSNYELITPNSTLPLIPVHFLSAAKICFMPVTEEEVLRAILALPAHKATPAGRYLGPRRLRLTLVKPPESRSSGKMRGSPWCPRYCDHWSQRTSDPSASPRLGAGLLLAFCKGGSGPMSTSIYNQFLNSPTSHNAAPLMPSSVYNPIVSAFRKPNLS